MYKLLQLAWEIVPFVFTDLHFEVETNLVSFLIGNVYNIRTDEWKTSYNAVSPTSDGGYWNEGKGNFTFGFSRRPQGT